MSLKQHMISDISYNSSNTSAGDLPRVGFRCFLDITGKLTGNFLNKSSRDRERGFP